MITSTTCLIGALVILTIGIIYFIVMKQLGK